MTRYHAPPVSYPAGRARLETWGLAALWLLALGLLGLAAGQGADPVLHPRAAWALALGACLCLLAGGLAGRHLRRAPVGRLLWRQGAWSWWTGLDATPLPLERIELACDLQRVLLLRLWGAGDVPRWLWLERSRDPQRWDDLRRAVWASRR